MPTGRTLVVVGGGIVGLATARKLQLDHPGDEVVVLEKESSLAVHQSGHNSGVIHSGIYYPPGSYKARFAIAGSRSIAAYARERGIPHEITGKLIVATRPDELPRLDALYRRGLDHGLDVRTLDASEAREHEPHVAAIAAVHVASTGIVDYPAVASAFAQDLVEAGGRIDLRTAVHSVRPDNDRQVVLTTSGPIHADQVVTCAGLHSDHVAVASGAGTTARIVAFRGEYYELTPAAGGLVNGLVYPVPDPDFPFLGVHLTRGIDGSVHAGPNAVLALAREGYRWRDVSPGELLSLARSRGFRRLAARHARQGFDEMRRSVSKSLFLRELQRLVPEIESRDLVRSPAGVRAQALSENGDLVDDFLLVDQHGTDGAPRGDQDHPQILHVLNAPSPAATSSIEIGSEISRRMGLRAR
ncbi:MAG: L-2-hydroxyglutarate oxidase [Microthrixaceae bacterium]